MSCLPKLTELLRLCVELVSKISNLCDHNPPTSQTDRRTTCDSKTVLYICIIVNLAVKINGNWIHFDECRHWNSRRNPSLSNFDLINHEQYNVISMFMANTGWAKNEATLHFAEYLDKKAVLLQRWLRNVPHIWVPWKFSRLADAHGYYSQHFSSTFVLIDPMKDVDLGLSIPEIIGDTQKNWGSPLIRPRSIFSKNFNGLLFGLAL